MSRVEASAGMKGRPDRVYQPPNGPSLVHDVVRHDNGSGAAIRTLNFADNRSLRPFGNRVLSSLGAVQWHHLAPFRTRVAV